MATSQSAEKRYICIAGKSGSGKETIYKLIKAELEKRVTTSIHHFSDPVNEDLASWGIPQHRHNQQEWSRMVRTGSWVDEQDKPYPPEWSEGAFCRVISKRAREDKAEVVFLDGVRRPADLGMIRTLPGSVLLFVTADPRTRYERLKKRADRPGDAEKTWEQFCKEQQANSEKDIDTVGQQAEFTIDNSGSMEDLGVAVGEFIAEHFKSA